MSEYEIHPLTDAHGNPITRDPYIPELGDYMLVHTPDGVHEVQVTGSSNTGDGTTGYTLRTIH
ncbi:hypothetical protein GKZ75_08470 [Kocuria indica]|uniref:Uncharacterized protein n=1 Tax=Kocuria marina subsp. indica TaxID=1049583 RepID=A0A6N9QYD4_9MICC|nr:hypothetical protein [Kocuria indica]NDO78256.1 hypothetical protein [Kocuria indica]